MSGSFDSFEAPFADRGPVGFDEARLDDSDALADADPYLRYLAESGARVRRETAVGAEALAAMREPVAPRALVAAGTDARLLRAVLEPTCPVPFVAWPGPGLPGWAGPLDVVVVLAGDGGDQTGRSAVAEAVRRGCMVIVAAPRHAVIADGLEGRRDVVLLPTSTTDPFAVAVDVLTVLYKWELGPHVDFESVATVLDDVAAACSPRHELGDNPAKDMAIALAEHTPLVWGGSVLAARAGRRVAELLRRSTGLAVLAADSEQIRTVLTGTRPKDPFADPFDDLSPQASPVLVILDDGSTESSIREQNGRLLAAAEDADVRVVRIVAPPGPGVVDEYASLLQQGSYAAAYLAIGLGRTPDLLSVL